MNGIKLAAYSKTFEPTIWIPKTSDVVIASATLIALYVAFQLS